MIDALIVSKPERALFAARVIAEPVVGSNLVVGVVVDIRVGTFGSRVS